MRGKDRIRPEKAPSERVEHPSADLRRIWAETGFVAKVYTVGDVDAYAAWDHERMAGFAEAVAGLQGDWMVTVNDSPENLSFFRGHEIRPVVTNSGAVNRLTRPAATFFAELSIYGSARSAFKWLLRCLWRLEVMESLRRAG